MTEDDIQNEESIRDLFKKAFVDGSQYQVLTIILVRLGWFAADPAEVKPELHAFAGWLLRKIGAIHDVPGIPDLFDAQAHDLTLAMVRAANSQDLFELRKITSKGTKPDELELESRR
jgi:hypothetical protein